MSETLSARAESNDSPHSAGGNMTHSGEAGLTIGFPASRQDGVLKVTGKARYAADHPIPLMAHAVAVQSTIARGRIVHIDTSESERTPGFLGVLHHQNFPKLFRPTNSLQTATKPGEIRTVFEDDRIYYAGQYVALVMAETLEQAQYSASRMRIDYEVEKPLVETEASTETLYDPVQGFYEKLAGRRGNPEQAWNTAPVRHEASYYTPGEHHNPIEPSATIAVWKGEELTLYETTQWVVGARNTVAETLGISSENVRIISPFIGGAFGCKGFTWPHSVLAAVAAKTIGRPVKLSLTRKQMFSSCGRRSETIQKIALGAASDGKLLSIMHDTLVQTSPVDEFIEVCGSVSRFLYSCPNVAVAHHAVRVNIATPTVMRAPGIAPGTFALESAMDELACKLKIDPVQLRILNHADINENTGLPWSSKNLKECYQLGAEKFRWSERPPEPRSMREGDALVGWGMATATYAGQRNPGAAKVAILRDGSASVMSATQDMGGGTYTTMAQVASEITGIPVGRIRTSLGDSSLPPAPVSGGSMTTASVLPAVKLAAEDARNKIIRLAIETKGSPLYGHPKEELEAGEGRVFLKTAGPNSGISFSAILEAGNLAEVVGESFVRPGEERQQYAFQSFGAQFAEVKVHLATAHVQVTRMTGVFDVGRVVNPLTARSQGFSGMIMGLGMALMEQTLYDSGNGRIINSNLADYAIPVHADIPDLDCYFIDKPDPHMDTQGIGARGVGEVTMAGVAAAIANAVYHATGIRVRRLPITTSVFAGIAA